VCGVCVCCVCVCVVCVCVFYVRWRHPEKQSFDPGLM